MQLVDPNIAVAHYSYGRERIDSPLRN